MKTGWKTLMVAGVAVLGLSSLVMAGAGRRAGFRSRTDARGGSRA